MTVGRCEYRNPWGEWLSSSQAQAAIKALASRLERADERERAQFCRERWRTVAARPSLWAELEDHLAAISGNPCPFCGRGFLHAEDCQRQAHAPFNGQRVQYGQEALDV